MWSYSLCSCLLMGNWFHFLSVVNSVVIPWICILTQIFKTRIYWLQIQKGERGQVGYTAETESWLCSHHFDGGHRYFATKVPFPVSTLPGPRSPAHPSLLSVEVINKSFHSTQLSPLAFAELFQLAGPTVEPCFPYVNSLCFPLQNLNTFTCFVLCFWSGKSWPSKDPYNFEMTNHS